MLRFLLLAASFLSAAPAYWTQKSIGPNPVAPFTLARLDTTIAPQIHDTADVLRKYTRDRIKDSLVDIRAALPAYVRRIGDTITGPIVGTTATATPLINITTTFGNLANAAIRGTATVANGSALYGVATGANGTGVRGSSTGSTGDGGFFYGANGSNALRAYAIGSGDAGRFEGNVKILGTTTLASSLTGILKANAGVVSVADTSDFPTRQYLPLAAGSGSPLTGVLYGQGLNFTTTADAPISVSHNLAGAFTHPFQAFNSGMVAGNQYNFDFGQSASTNNAGNFGFKYVGAGSASNYVTLGLYGANDLMTITAAGVPKFSGLATAGFVRANASGQLSSSTLTYADITGTVPTWNQNTTGNAATATKWATARTLTIGSTGKAVDGSANVSWSLGEIGALPLAGGVMNTGAQIKVVADVTTSTSTNTVFNTAPLLVSRASSSGSAVAAIGFFNPGLNGAALYYSTSSDFRYNRHTGDIVTIWDNSNLTPSAIGAATTTHAATHLAGGSDQIAGQSLSGLRTTDAPVFASLKLGSSGGAAPTANTPLVVRNASSYSAIRIESGTTEVAASQWANASASWSLGVRSDGLSGSPVGALVAADATSARMWLTSAGITVPGQLAAGSAVLKTYTTDPNYFSLWGDGASAPNYTLAGSRNGAEVYLNGSTKTVLNVGAHERVIATAAGVSFPLLTGTGTRMVTAAANGTLGATSWAYDGPWLPLAGGTVSGYTNFANDIGTQRQFVGNGDIFVRAGAVLLRAGNGNDWADAAVQFPSTSTVQSFRVDGGAQFNSAVQFTAGAVHGASKQIATHLYSTSSTLPALAQGEWCWVVMDQSGSGSAYWSTPSTRSLRYYAGGTTTTLVPASTQMVVPNNGTAWILYGPAYSGTTQMTLVM